MDIGNLPSARMSPRIVNGVIKWYEGDTFSLRVEIELTDEADEQIMIQPTDEVRFVFRNNRKEIVHEIRETNIENNCVTLYFTENVSAKFPKGRYEYDVYYNGEERKTLSNDSPIVVE